MTKSKTNECEENNECVSEEEAKKLARVQFLILTVLFLAVIAITTFITMLFGKSAGTIALIIIGVMLAGWLYKDEIQQKLQRK